MESTRMHCIPAALTGAVLLTLLLAAPRSASANAAVITIEPSDFALPLLVAGVYAGGVGVAGTATVMALRYGVTDRQPPGAVPVMALAGGAAVTGLGLLILREGQMKDDWPRGDRGRGMATVLGAAHLLWGTTLMLYGGKKVAERRPNTGRSTIPAVPSVTLGVAPGPGGAALRLGGCF